MIKISRAEWGARPPRQTPIGINTRSNTDHWEGTTLGTFPHESCPSKVRGIQSFHMDGRGWNDIAYNFVVCPHGFVFVGRDHGIRSAANGTNPGNDESEAACYLGGPGDEFTEAAKIAFVEINREIGGPTHPHQYWFNTACPGNEIIDWINAGQPAQTNPNVPTIPSNAAFPLPSGHWFGPPSKDPRNHSGYYDPRDRLLVAWAQRVAVVKCAQTLQIDGFFGASTLQAMKNIQRYMGTIGFDVGESDLIHPSGLVGPKTWSVLNYIWNAS
jgi:peptidoglycan hydrolase-like protein with peptidoglycan-binding domain